MNPFDSNTPDHELDYLLARYKADEATPQERARLDEYIDGDARLAAFVEAQRAEFIATFPNYQGRKARGLERLQKTIRELTPELALPSLGERVREAVLGKLDEVRRVVVAMCSAGELALATGSGASVTEHQKYVTKTVDGITVTLSTSPAGLKVIAESERAEDEHASVAVFFHATTTNLSESSAALASVAAAELPAGAVQLCEFKLAADEDAPGSFAQTALVAPGQLNDLQRDTYYVVIQRQP